MAFYLIFIIILALLNPSRLQRSNTRPDRSELDCVKIKIINYMVIDLMIKMIKLVFFIYKVKDLINESFAIFFQSEKTMAIEGNRNFNIIFTLN